MIVPTLPTNIKIIRVSVCRRRQVRGDAGGQADGANAEVTSNSDHVERYAVQQQDEDRAGRDERRRRAARR